MPHPCPSSSSIDRHHSSRFHHPKNDPDGPTGSEGISVILIPFEHSIKQDHDHVKSPHTQPLGSLARRSALWATHCRLAFVRSSGRSVGADEVSPPPPQQRSTKKKKLAKIERYRTSRKRGKRERPPEGRLAGGKIEGSVRRKLMRLLSFVPFGCRAGPVDDAPPADHAATAAGDAAAAARRRQRRRVARSAVGAAQYWRPSLGDIYEEYSTDAAKAAAAAGPARARKAASWDVARVLPRARSDEYRHLERASSMPAFAPTAYLF